MKKTIVTILFFIFACIGFSTDYALVIGINDYENLPKLLYADNDAYDMAELLEEQGFEIILLVDSEATGEKIISELKRIVALSTEKDSVMLFFSGHGMAGEDLSQRGFFPVDTDLETISQISQDDVIEILKQTRANKIIFLDACFQGSRTKDLVRKPKVERFDIQTVVEEYDLDLFIAASASNEAAYDGIIFDGEKISNGIATFLFLRGMETGAIDMDKNTVVTNGEIAEYFESMSEMISSSVSQKPEAAYSIYRNHLFTFSDKQSSSMEETEPVTTGEPDIAVQEKYSFTVNTEPSKARLYINNMIFGYTPVKVNNVEIDSVLRFVLDGYEIYEVNLSDISVQAEMTFRLNKEWEQTTTVNVPDYLKETVSNHVNPEEENIFNSDVTIAVDNLELYTDKVSNAAIIARLNEQLNRTNAVEVVDRENIGNIIEEKKINTSSNRKVIESAEYYISGNLYEEGNRIMLYLYLVDMSDSTKHLTKNLKYGETSRDEFTEDKHFKSDLKKYVNHLVDYLCSPIKSKADDHHHTLDLLSSSTVKVDDVLIFDFDTSFDNCYFFTSSPSGRIEFIGNLEGGGHQEISAEAEIADIDRSEITEYLIAFGSEKRISTDKFMDCRTIEDLENIIIGELKNYQYAIAFTSYTISR